MTQTIHFRHGDSLKILKELPDNSVGCFILDPPYGIEFMGKAWDAPWKVIEGSSELGFSRSFQVWCGIWLTECLRTLVPGGKIKIFGATRMFHRLAQAMEDVGFTLDPEKSLEAWAYGSGFPKSLNLTKAFTKADKLQEAAQFEGYGTALKPAWEPFLVGSKT